MRQTIKRIKSQKSPGLTITMALWWLIKSRGHSFIWSSHLCESHTCGHTGSNSLPLKRYLTTSGISKGGDKMGFFFSVFEIFVRAFSCPHLHNAFCRQQNKNKRREIKHIQRKGRIPYTGMYCRNQRNQTFKDCSGVIRSVVIAVIHLVFFRDVLSLYGKIGIFGSRKTYENLSF